MVTLHLGVVNGEVDTVDRAWDCFCDVLVMIGCPGDLGVGICAWFYVYCSDVFGLLCMMWRMSYRCSN